MNCDDLDWGDADVSPERCRCRRTVAPFGPIVAKGRK